MLQRFICDSAEWSPIPLFSRSVGRQQLLIILVGKAICYEKEATNLKGKNWEIRYDFVKTIGPS